MLFFQSLPFNCESTRKTKAVCRNAKVSQAEAHCCEIKPFSPPSCSSLSHSTVHYLWKIVCSEHLPSTTCLEKRSLGLKKKTKQNSNNKINGSGALGPWPPASPSPSRTTSGTHNMWHQAIPVGPMSPQQIPCVHILLQP